jgi:hypothetical protein
MRREYHEPPDRPLKCDSASIGCVGDSWIGHVEIMRSSVSASGAAAIGSLGKPKVGSVDISDSTVDATGSAIGIGAGRPDLASTAAIDRLTVSGSHLGGIGSSPSKRTAQRASRISHHPNYLTVIDPTIGSCFADQVYSKVEMRVGNLHLLTPSACFHDRVKFL